MVVAQPVGRLKGVPIPSCIKMATSIAFYNVVAFEVNAILRICFSNSANLLFLSCELACALFFLSWLICTLGWIIVKV